ncbi:response regulator [Kurthia sibirica]|uniref:Two-component system response regulator n=1 Tax=Kurthia sibirica TaxID=202750 RepID=A0A2U3ALI8_9BACL|nr:response regulator [Kurthia sibirica]PWI25370.1 two-component system response regulator [Kurthia sibirica]GEK34614.1 chemotaxis protein CheY [Kurthia sibirica]
MTTLLVVDDALFMRETVKAIASEGGFEIVGEAENGQQAIEQYRKLQPDLVTMDITMPVLSGLDATKAIVEEFPQARIIVITALGQQKLVIKALENGAKDFLTKPFDREQFISTLRQISAY